jgi:hypothetical protein
MIIGSGYSCCVYDDNGKHCLDSAAVLPRGRITRAMDEGSLLPQRSSFGYRDV